MLPLDYPWIGIAILPAECDNLMAVVGGCQLSEPGTSARNNLEWIDSPEVNHELLGELFGCGVFADDLDAHSRHSLRQ